MTPDTRAAWATWNAEIQQSIDAYWTLPTATGHVAEAPNRPCTVCGRRTQSLRRMCRGCQEKRP